MLKRIMILSVVALMMLIVAACGGKSKEAPAPAPTEAPAAAPTEAPATQEQSAAPEAPIDAGAALAAALDAAQNKDWTAVETNLKAALDASADPQQQAVIQQMLDDLSAGNNDKVAEDLLEETLGSGEAGEGAEAGASDQGGQSAESGEANESAESGEASNAPEAGDAMASLSAALDAANAGDWEQVQQSLEDAAASATDAQQKAAIEEMLDDLSKGNNDEVLADLEKIVSGQAAADPVMGKLDKALDYAKDGNWDKVNEELSEAADLTTDAQQKAAIEELLDDLANSKYDEVVDDLGKLQG